MNYIIWNDKDSRDITGLLISELPPISKPNMRVSETTVDGVDGSTFEDLGYESYNKTVSIGLRIGTDVDKIIEYFTGEGKVIFSNEPHKYYLAKITGQIDFTRLLRYKTATVNFRVQPFKYEHLEEPSKLIGGTITGTSLILKNKKITEFAIEGKSTQSGTPSPDAPAEITSVGEGQLYVFAVAEDGVTIPTEILLTEPLRSLPNGAKDIAYIKNNKLYVNRYVGSLVFDGDENFFVANDANDLFFFAINGYKSQYAMSSHFNNVINDEITHNNAGSNLLQSGEFAFRSGDVKDRVYFKTSFATLDEFKAWLTENNVELLYELATPTIEEIGEISTISTFEGQTYIYNSESANMVITYVEKNMFVENMGNYIAKPIIELRGAGTVEVAVNGNAMFRYTFPEDENTVVIDCEKQDAYLDADLKNRNMYGEFPILKVGSNVIDWEGAVESVKITKYSRWL